MNIAKAFKKLAAPIPDFATRQSHLDAVPLAAAVSQWAEMRQRAAVVDSRAEGASWDTLAELLSLSRSSVAEAYGGRTTPPPGKFNVEPPRAVQDRAAYYTSVRPGWGATHRYEGEPDWRPGWAPFGSDELEFAGPNENYVVTVCGSGGSDQSTEYDLVLSEFPEGPGNHVLVVGHNISQKAAQRTITTLSARSSVPAWVGWCSYWTHFDELSAGLASAG